MITQLNPFIWFAFLIYLILSFCQCAHQLPPPGGEEDKKPPKIISIYPKPNTLNFKDDKIIISFDEYVDRRSFIDAYRISPPIKGDVEFQWSGKEVIIQFPKPLYKQEPQKTFIVNLNSSLRDLYGNSLTQPISFAFSTSDKIDKASVSGKVFNNDNRIIKIFAYKISDNKLNYEPSYNIADYITETSITNEYSLTHLSPGTYRIISVDDNDLNMLYTQDRENYAVLPNDLTLSDTSNIKNINFYIHNFRSKPTLINGINITNFYKDSLAVVSTSIPNNSKNIPIQESIFILFHKFIPQRNEFVNSFKLLDKMKKPTKVVFNWKNDSLLEIFSPNPFAMGESYHLIFDLKIKSDSIYKFNLYFTTASQYSLGAINGKIYLPQASIDSKKIHKTIISLNSIDTLSRYLNYTFEIYDTNFTINNIIAGEYNLFAYIDENYNGYFDSGNPLPFQYSEKFYVYPISLKIIGGWTIENVVLDFR